MNIVFMGTPEFALESLRALDARGIGIAGVVTQPDKLQGRGNLMIPSPVKQYAVERGFRIFQPRRAEEIVDELKSLDPDFIIVVAFGQILKRPALEIPRKAIVNVHGSILPKYRGASPINWAIVNGETETGVTTMLLDEGMDTGDMLLVEKVRIGPDDTASDLHDRLAAAGARLLLETIENFDGIKPEKQDNSLATYAPKMSKDTGRIDWTKPSERIRNLVRGCTPWPSAFSRHDGTILKIWKLEVSGEASGATADPGTISSVEKDRISVATGDGVVSILEIQREGKKRQNVGTFLQGYKIKRGDKLN
jgi:methionyl-tRNA formyltransferase